MYLETKRCIIRRFDCKDVAAVYETLSDEEVMHYIEPAFDMDRTIGFIEKCGLCDAPLIYAVQLRETSQVIGHVIYHPYDKQSYEIGWVLNRAHWGKGIADEITKALVQHTKTTAKACVIECDERQEISRHIALKNGFEYVGTDNGIAVYRLELQK